MEEINKRHQLESELDALRNYVDYIKHKKAERLRNKGVQTETTIPMRMACASAKFTNPFVKANPNKTNKFGTKQKAYSNFKTLESAVSLWQTKVTEQEFQKQTKAMEQRFIAAMTPDLEFNKKLGLETASLLNGARAPPIPSRALSWEMA